VFLGISKRQNADCNQCDARKEGIFSVLSEKEMEIYSKLKSCNHYGKHQVVFYEGNAPLAIYCIQKGVVKLHRSAVDGRNQIVHLAKPGELLGYTTLLSGERYPYTAETVEESDICVIDKTAFFKLLEVSPRVVRHLLENTCSELDQANAAACSMAQKSVRERVAEALLLLKEAHGTRAKNGTRIDLTLSRQEIADLAGTVLETAVRFLSEFKDDGYIALNGREVTILDSDGLMKAANIQQ
jgi:CRP/FNR family transcriptional regulator